MPNNATDNTLALPHKLFERQARRYLKKHAWHLRFPLELEQYYLARIYPDRITHLVRFLLIGVLIYGLYIVVDYYLLGDNLLKAALIRFLACIPFMLLGIYLFAKKSLFGFSEYTLMVGSVIVAMSVLWIENLATPAAATIYNTGTMVVVLYCNVVLQQRFINALVSSLIVLVISLANRISVLQGDLHLSMVIADHIAIVGLSLVANYMINLAQRRSFLQALLLELKAQAMEKLAVSDALTGVYNRRFFTSALDQTISRALRNKSPLSLLFIDVDCFKSYNDFYGHKAGDDCLISLTRKMDEALRNGDVLARHGGEEFTVLLENTDQAAAEMVAKRIQSKIDTLGLPHEQSTVNDYVTVSIGICTQQVDASGINEMSLINNADKALYMAKAQGRNRIVIYE